MLSESNSTPDATTTYFTFTAGGQRLAFPLLDVERVVRSVEITPLPQPIPGFAGVVNIHGEVAAVIALHCWGHGSENPEESGALRQPQLSDHFVLVRHEDRLLALWVESLDGVVTLSAADRVAAPNPLGNAPASPWHLLKSGDGMLLEVQLPILLASAPGDWQQTLTSLAPES